MSGTDTDGRLLYAAIVREPEEDTPRLMYADWLEENGDPERAEFIRLQVELSRMPPKPRELFVADGAGQRMEGLGVRLTYEGDGHYSASTGERGLSAETFTPGERVDVYAELAGKVPRRGWMRGLRYVKHVEGRQLVVFRKDDKSGPWVGAAPTTRADALLALHRARWLRVECPACGGTGRALAEWEHDEGGGFTIGACSHCNGGGDAGGLTWKTRDDEVMAGFQSAERYRGTTTFARGFPERVTVPRLADVVEPYRSGYDDASDTYRRDGFRPTPWARAAVRHHPVVEFVPADALPCLERRGNVFLWRDDVVFDHDPRLPAAICPKEEFPFRQAAVDALARALGELARRPG
jgi:uncharacterized protein (TIGR02996 family)